MLICGSSALLSGYTYKPCSLAIRTVNSQAVSLFRESIWATGMSFGIDTRTPQGSITERITCPKVFPVFWNVSLLRS